MAAAYKLEDITSDYWALSMVEEGEVVQGEDDISQCIGMILGTVKGTIPFMPDFGCDILGAIDKPLPEAAIQLRAEAIRQIAIYEPRAKVVNVLTKIDGESIIMAVTWQPSFEFSQLSNTFETTYTR